MKKRVTKISGWMFLPALVLLGLHTTAYAARYPNITISDVTVTEGEQERAVFTVSIDASPSRNRTLSVVVATLNGSAQSSSDFEYSRQTLTFDRGDPLSQQFSVPIIDDQEPEQTEVFSVELSNAQNGRIIDNSGDGTILDNDTISNQAPTCRIDSPAGDTAVPVGGTVNFTATVSDADGDSVFVSWLFEGGAPAGSTLEDPGAIRFPSVGTYTVSLDASDNSGEQCERQSLTVSVTTSGVAAVSINSTSISGFYPGAFSPVAERPQVLGGSYSVFAVNDLGMHCVDLDGRVVNILPQFQVLLGQVIQKGVWPTLNPAGVSLSYSAASNPLDPVLTSGAASRGIAVDGTVYKTNFWQGIPFGSYDAFFPPLFTPLDSGPFPVTGDKGLPVPNVELLYLGENGIVGDGDERLAAVQHAMPGVTDPMWVNAPQPMLEHYINKPFFINFPMGYVAANVNWLEAAGIPMSPFDDAGRQNTFPLVRVEASAGGSVLATSDAVLPVSSETSCTNCHSSPGDITAARSTAPAQALLNAGLPVVDRTADPLLNSSVPLLVSLEYAADINILRLHDLKHGSRYVKPLADGSDVVHQSDPCVPTDGSTGSASCLVNRALTQKQPIVCQTCHYTPALDLAQVGPVAGPPGSDANGRNQLAHETNSRVMHNHHGKFTDLFPPIPAPVQNPLTGAISNQVERVAALENNCYQCHPGKETRCLRGAMYNADILCSDCHGTMAQIGADFSAGVAPDNVGAFTLDKGNFYDPASAQPRVPWANEPGCGSCHSGHANDNLTGKSGVVVNLKDSHGVTDGIRLRQAFVTGDPKATPIVPGNKMFAEPAVMAVFNGFDNPAAGNPRLYRVSTGHGGVMCAGCHGSTHAEWPVKGGANSNDNLLAIQVQGHDGSIIECVACHTTSGLAANTMGGPHNMHLVNDQRFWKEAHKDLAKRENSKAGRGQCGNCHGADHRGTVLSRAAVDRSFLVEGTQRRVGAGQPVSCSLCHSLEKSFGG
jgi:PKD repeat protein